MQELPCRPQRAAGDLSTGADTECTVCADGYYVSALGADSSTPGTCTICATGFTTTGVKSDSTGAKFATKELGCTKTAAGYYLTKVGSGSSTSAAPTSAACPAGFTTAGGADATSGGTKFATAALGCLKTAPGYYLKTVGSGSATT